MNECKRLSDCPADRLAQCRGEAVPPAGDVEVLPERPYASAEEQSGMTEYEIGLGHGSLEMWDKFLLIVTRMTAERNRLLAEVARLKEERDGIGGLIEKLNAMTYARDLAHRAHMREQSELTKARESISELIKYSDALQAELRNSRGLLARRKDLESEIDTFLAAPLVTPIACNVDESCGQDAEAAKGGA